MNRMQVSRRGRPSKPPKNSQQALITSILKKHGGSSKIARDLKLGIYTVLSWRYNGRVALIASGFVSRHLGVNKWALNYREVCQIEGSANKPDWEELVREEAREEDVASILKYKPPSTELLPYVD